MHTVTTAAALLGSSRPAVLRACRRLGVPKHGPVYQIDAEALEAIRGLVRPGQPGCPAFGTPAGAELGRMGGLASAPERKRRAKAAAAERASARETARLAAEWALAKTRKRAKRKK